MFSGQAFYGSFLHHFFFFPIPVQVKIHDDLLFIARGVYGAMMDVSYWKAVLIGHGGYDALTDIPSCEAAMEAHGGEDFLNYFPVPVDVHRGNQNWKIDDSASD